MPDTPDNHDTPPPSAPSTPAPSAAIAPVVAMDGPAGAGKSTVARALARRLGFLLLDTGAIYRAVGLAARRAALPLDDDAAVGALAATLDIHFVPAPDSDAGQRVMLGDEDVSTAIRTPQASEDSSRVSSLPAVRRALLDLQRTIARRGRCVVEGRDIGSVVLPWAPLKFFVTASPAVRARRRHDELLARGLSSDFDATLAQILERDRRDETRATAPLIQAPDAILVDTSDLSIDEVVDRMERLARTRLAL